jgi:3-deoxy-7-phosphoheptulonate synthase
MFGEFKISRKYKNNDTIIKIKKTEIGGDNLVIIAGPCSIENREMIFKIAKAVKEAGGHILRGGAFKPRTSPYDFQGLGEEGLVFLKEAGEMYGLLTVTEVVDTRDIETVKKYVDILQVGARNMQNFALLKELGSCGKPVLLKRGLSATIKEFLMAAEYLMVHGNEEIILCERGIRTFETMTRNTVDISVIPFVRQQSHLPIIIDASHGTGIRTLVEPVTLAGIMAGANGIMIEIHEVPEEAVSDSEQTLDFETFKITCEKSRKVHNLKTTL